MARRIALQAWKRDIEAVFVAEGGEGPQEYENESNWQAKMEVLELVEGLIAGCR